MGSQQTKERVWGGRLTEVFSKPPKVMAIAYESEVSANNPPPANPAELGRNLLHAAGEQTSGSSLDDLRNKFEDNLDRFSRQMRGRANYHIGLIGDRQKQIAQLELELSASTQEFQAVEAEFARRGGSGQLTDWAADRAEIAYHSYLAAHRQETAKVRPNHRPGPNPDLGEAVSYRDFLLYGVLAFGQTQTDSRNYQSLPVQSPPYRMISQADKKSVVYIPAHNRADFEALRQSEDLSNSPLLENLSDRGDDWQSPPPFDFGVYGSINVWVLERSIAEYVSVPVGQKMLLAAADYLVLRKTAKDKIRGLRLEAENSRWELQNLSRRTQAS